MRLLLVFSAILICASAASAGVPSPLEIAPGASLLVIAPHPDDETLGAGGLIQRVRERGGTIRIALVTAGDGYIEAVKHETHELHPRPAEYVAYGEQRLREARAAVRLLAGELARLQVLGFPDGGLESLLHAHWWRSAPERSRTTDATDPPYSEALEPDLPYDGDDLRRELDRIVRETAPTIVAVPDPLDRHPDHRAAGLFALLAVADWIAGLPKDAPRPLVLTYLVHWPAWPPGWDGATPPSWDTPLELPSAFPGKSRRKVALVLDRGEIDLKRAALARYTTQQRVMGPLLQSFVRRTEPFTVVPENELPAVERLVEEGVPQSPRKRR